MNKGSAEARSEFDLNLRSAIHRISYAVSHNAGILSFSPEIAGRILRAITFLDMAAEIEGRTSSREHKNPLEKLKQSIADAYQSVESAIRSLGSLPPQNQPLFVNSVNEGLNKAKNSIIRAMAAINNILKHTGKEERIMSMSGIASLLHHAKLVLHDTAQLITRNLAIETEKTMPTSGTESWLHRTQFVMHDVAHLITKNLAAAASGLTHSLQKAIRNIGRAMIFVYNCCALLTQTIPYVARSIVSKMVSSEAVESISEDDRPIPVETRAHSLRKSLANLARDAVDDVEGAMFELLKHRQMSTSGDNSARVMLRSAQPILREIYESERDVDTEAILTEELYASQQAILHRCAEQISLLSVSPEANVLVGKALASIVRVVFRLQELRTKPTLSLEVPYEFLENAAESLEDTLRMRSATVGVRASVDKKRLQKVIREQAALYTPQQDNDKCKIASGADIALIFRKIVSEHNEIHLRNSGDGKHVSPLVLIKEIAEEAQVSVEGGSQDTKQEAESISLPATFICDLLYQYLHAMRLIAAVEGISVEEPKRETIMGIIRTLFPEAQHSERVTLHDTAGIVSAFREASTILRNQVQEYSALVAQKPIAETKTPLDLIREVIEGSTRTPGVTEKGDDVRITPAEGGNVVVPSAVAHSAILASMLATQDAVISQMGKNARSLPRFTAEYVSGLVGKKFPVAGEQWIELSLEHMADVYKEFERELQQNSTSPAAHIKIPDGFVTKISNIIESVAKENAVEGAEYVVHKQVRGKVYAACVIALHKEHYKSATLPILRDMIASMQDKHTEVSDAQLEEAAESVISLVEDSWGTEKVPAKALHRGVASITKALFSAKGTADASQVVSDKEDLKVSRDSLCDLLKAHRSLQERVNNASSAFCKLSDRDVVRLADGISKAHRCVLDLLHRNMKTIEQYSGEGESVTSRGMLYSKEIFVVLRDIESLLAELMDDNSQLTPEAKKLVSSAHCTIGKVLASIGSSSEIDITHMESAIVNVAETLFSPFTTRKYPSDPQQKEMCAIRAVCASLAVLAHLMEMYSSEDIIAGEKVSDRTSDATDADAGEKDEIDRSVDVELEKQPATAQGELSKHLRRSVTLLNGARSLCIQNKRMQEEYAIHSIYPVRKLDGALSRLEQAMEIVHSLPLEESSSAEARSAAMAQVREHIEHSTVSCILSSARAYMVPLPVGIFSALYGSCYSVLSALIELRRSLGEDMRHTKVPPESKAALVQVSAMMSLARESVKEMMDPAEADSKHVRETYDWSLRLLGMVEYLLQFVNCGLFADGQAGYVEIVSNVSGQLKICLDNLESLKHSNSENALLHKKIATFAVRVARDLVDEHVLQKMDTQEILYRWSSQEGDAKDARDLAIATVRMHEAAAKVRELADVLYTIDAKGNTAPKISAAEILCRTVYAEAKSNFNSVSHEEVSKSLDLLITDIQSLMSKLKNVTLKLANSTSLAEARELIWNDIAFIIDVSSKKRGIVASEEIQQLFTKTAALVGSVRDTLPTSPSKARQTPADDQEVAEQQGLHSATVREKIDSHTEHREAPKKHGSAPSEEFRTILNTSFKLSEQEAAALEILDGYAVIGNISANFDKAAELLRNTSSFGEDLAQTKLLAVTAFSNAVTLLALLEKQHGGCIPQDSGIVPSNSDVLRKAVKKYGVEAAGPVIAKFEIIVSQLALRAAVGDLRHTIQVLSAREAARGRVKQATLVLQTALDDSLALLENVTKRTHNLVNPSTFTAEFGEIVGHGLSAASARTLEFGYNRRGYSGLLESIENIQGSLGKQHKLAAHHDLLENMLYIGDFGSASFLYKNTELPDAACFEKVVNTIAGAMRKGAISADTALMLIKTVTDVRDESLRHGVEATAGQQVRGDITQIVIAFYEQGHENGLKFLRQKYNKRCVNAEKVEIAILGKLANQRQITSVEEVLLQGPERWVFSDLENEVSDEPLSRRDALKTQSGIEYVRAYIKSHLHTQKKESATAPVHSTNVSPLPFWRRCADATRFLVAQTEYVFRLLFRGEPGRNDSFLTRLAKAYTTFFHMWVSIILFVFAKRPICLSGTEEVGSDQARQAARSGIVTTEEGRAAGDHKVDRVDAKDTSSTARQSAHEEKNPDPKSAKTKDHRRKIVEDGQPSPSTTLQDCGASPMVPRGRRESTK
ncbi:MAG: hypothetical protein ACTJLL_02780 [Anaplasma sp.]